jgi:hypothetical protein
MLMNMCSAIESSKKYCRFFKIYIYMNIFMQILNQNNVDRRYCKTSRNQSTISLMVITILVGNRHTRRDRTRLNNTQQMYEHLWTYLSIQMFIGLIKNWEIKTPKKTTLSKGVGVDRKVWASLLRGRESGIKPCKWNGKWGIGGWVSVVSEAESGKRGIVRRVRENGGGMQCRRSGLKSIGKLFG